MEEIICKNCGSINDYDFELRNGQKVAWCKSCKTFIKNIPYNDPALYFGKYKGKAIKDYFTPDEVNYLHWIRNNPDIWDRKLNQRTRDAINLRLDGTNR
jgi:uncharacterized protein (DUF3820 family)